MPAMSIIFIRGRKVVGGINFCRKSSLSFQVAYHSHAAHISPQTSPNSSQLAISGVHFSEGATLLHIVHGSTVH